MICLVVITAYTLGQISEIEDSNAANGNINRAPYTVNGDVSDRGTIYEITEEGKYKVSISGGGITPFEWDDHGVSIAKSGKITGYVNLKSGDRLEFNVLDGGLYDTTGESTDRKGGDAAYIKLNNELLVGAAGAGGTSTQKARPSSKWRYSYSEGQSVTGIDNTKFSSGGAGGNTSNNSGTRGQDGNTLGNSTPARGGVIYRNESYGISEIAEAGYNYVNTDKFQVISEENNSNTVSFSIVYCGVGDNQQEERPNYGDNTLPEIGGSDVQSKITDNITYWVQKSGFYAIELWGEGGYYTESMVGTYDAQGGYAKAVLQLQEGDKVELRKITGGTGLGGSLPDVTRGKDAIIAYVNDEPYLGAGGAAGGTVDKKRRSVHSGESVTKSNIDGYIFSSGGGGTYRNSDGEYTYGGAGNTIFDGQGSAQGSAGVNYVNLKNVSKYEVGTASEINDDSARRARYKITNLGITEEYIDYAISNIKTIPSDVMLTCCENQDFEINFLGNTEIGDTVVTQSGIRLEVVDKDRNLLKISGKMEDSGVKQYVFGELTIEMSVIPQPSNSNIQAVLN